MKYSNQSEIAFHPMQANTGHVHVVSSVTQLLLTCTALVRSQLGCGAAAAAVMRCCVYVELLGTSH